MRSEHWKFTLWGFRLSNACTEYGIENDTSWDFMIEKSEMAVDGCKGAGEHELFRHYHAIIFSYLLKRFKI